MKTRYIILGFFVAFFFSVLGAQEPQESQNPQQSAEPELTGTVAEQRTPNWLLLEQGKKFYQQGEYGEALRLFLVVKDSVPYSPEASRQIARIFGTDNDLRLAVIQLRESLDQQEFFYDPNEIYKLHTDLAGLYYRLQEYHLYEASLLKIISMELGTTSVQLRKARQIRNILQKKGLGEVLYYYDDSFSHIVPALNELSLYYYNSGYYNDSIRLNLYSIISTMSQGINFLKDHEYIKQIPQNIDELYEINPEYIIEKLSLDLETVGIDYNFQWNLNDLSLKDPVNQFPEIITKIREIDPLYQFSLIGYYLNILERYPVVQELLYKQKLYTQLYFLASALSIQGFTDSANHLLNVLSYLPQAGEWNTRAKSQLRQAFIDKQVPLGSIFYSE